MGAHERAVDHQIPVISIGCQRLEDMFPDAGMAPTAEAFMERLPLAIAFRQIAPMCAGAQNLQAAIDKQAVVRARPTRIAGFAR